LSHEGNPPQKFLASRRSRRGRLSAPLIAAGLSLSFLGPIGTLPPGCSRAPGNGKAATPPEQVYTLRGRITSLPVKGQPLTELTIMHEDLPTFVGQDGTVKGMKAMEMPFPPAKGVSLEGLAVGDPVEFTFEMRWKSQPHSQLTRIKKLPADTDLRISKPDHSG
jgi:copper binding protein CusF